MEIDQKTSWQNSCDNFIQLAILIHGSCIKRIQEMIQELVEDDNGLKKFISNASEAQREIDLKKAIRASWILDKDTRLTSQVTDNKPRHLVKKIIH